MANGFYNNQTRSSPVKASGGGYDNPRGGSKMAFNEKVGFPKAALPGKSQGKDRSGGVKRVKDSPDKKGL